VAALAQGDADATSDRQRGMDRYATSKLCAMVAAMELARRHPGTAFATFDPGLMPGTGLLRSGPWYARVAWRTVLRWIAPLLDDASTPKRSAKAARQLLLCAELAPGAVYGHDGALSRRVWQGARDPALAQRVVDESLSVLARRGASSPGSRAAASGGALRGELAHLAAERERAPAVVAAGADDDAGA
jgi:hypothetical protein